MGLPQHHPRSRASACAVSGSLPRADGTIPHHRSRRAVCEFVGTEPVKLVRAQVRASKGCACVDGGLFRPPPQRFPCMTSKASDARALMSSRSRSNIGRPRRAHSTSRRRRGPNPNCGSVSSTPGADQAPKPPEACPASAAASQSPGTRVPWTRPIAAWRRTPRPATSRVATCSDPGHPDDSGSTCPARQRKAPAGS